MSNGTAARAHKTHVLAPKRLTLFITNRILNNLWARAVIIPAKILNMVGRKLLLRRRVRLALHAFELSKKLRGLECVDRKALVICTLASGKDAEALALLQRVLTLEPDLMGDGGAPLEAEENYNLDGVPKDKAQTIIGTGLLVLLYELTADYLHAKGMGNITTILGGKAFEFRDIVRPYAKAGTTAQEFLQKNNIALSDLSIFPTPWTNQIGHIGMLEIMFRMREIGWWRGNAVVLARRADVANQAFLDMVLSKANALIVYEEQDPALFADLSRLLNSHGRPFHVFRPPNQPWMRWHDAAALAMLTQSETGNAQRFSFRPYFDSFMNGRKSRDVFDRATKEWGLEGGWYACLHLRRSEHDMGQANRNSSLENYALAIDYITQQGGKVVLMGASQEGAFSEIKGLINYPATPFKSEEMDLLLIRNCKFFIGTTSGLANVAVSLDIPTAQRELPDDRVSALELIGALLPETDSAFQQVLLLTTRFDRGRPLSACDQR